MGKSPLVWHGALFRFSSSRVASDITAVQPKSEDDNEVADDAEVEETVEDTEPLEETDSDDGDSGIDVFVEYPSVESDPFSFSPTAPPDTMRIVSGCIFD